MQLYNAIDYKVSQYIGHLKVREVITSIIISLHGYDIEEWILTKRKLAMDSLTLSATPSTISSSGSSPQYQSISFTAHIHSTTTDGHFEVDSLVETCQEIYSKCLHKFVRF
jgi:hypothetical protein